MSKTWLPGSLLLVVLSACSKPAPEPEIQPAIARIQIDPGAQPGVINGTVSLTGTAGQPEKIDMSQDPGCVLGNPEPNFSPSLAVDRGQLANVYVYIKDGPPTFQNATYPAATATAVIDQRGCRYIPHVLGVRVGQLVQILNSDSTMHNVHPAPEHNPAWNESQMPRGVPLEKTFNTPELMVPIKCNQHPWMKMYLNISTHPYFAVTGADGKFQIKGLPPGDYTLAALHEKLGEQTMKIKVGDQAASADFSFAATPR
jgi:plastocyanin